MPVYQDKQLKRFLVDEDSVAETERKRMMQNYEEARKEQVEWRAQHSFIEVEQEDLKDKKKKRAKSEITKIQQRYIGTVTSMKANPKIKEGKCVKSKHASDV